jgi:hypothetical protein
MASVVLVIALVLELAAVIYLLEVFQLMINIQTTRYVMYLFLYKDSLSSVFVINVQWNEIGLL